jgi:hypothetical protein
LLHTAVSMGVLGDFAIRGSMLLRVNPLKSGSAELRD